MDSSIAIALVLTALIALVPAVAPRFARGFAYRWRTIQAWGWRAYISLGLALIVVAGLLAAVGSE